MGSLRSHDVDVGDVAPGGGRLYDARWGARCCDVRACTRRTWVAWWLARARGKLAALAPKERGRRPKVVDPRDGKITELERQVARLNARAERAEGAGRPMIIRKAGAFRLLPMVGVVSLLSGCGVGLFLGKDVQVEVSPGATEDDLRKIRKVGVAYGYGHMPRPEGAVSPPAVFLRRLIANLAEKGRRFEVVKEEVFWRVFAEIQKGDWEERYVAAAKRAGADGLIRASVTFYSPSATRLREGGRVADARAELVSLADPTTVMAKVAVAYESPGAAIDQAASALAEAIQERIPPPQ